MDNSKRQIWRDIAPLVSIATILFTSFRLSTEIGEKYGRLTEQVKGLDTRIQTIERRQEFLYSKITYYALPESTQFAKGDYELPNSKYSKKTPIFTNQGLSSAWYRSFDSGAWN